MRYLICALLFAILIGCGSDIYPNPKNNTSMVSILDDKNKVVSTIDNVIKIHYSSNKVDSEIYILHGNELRCVFTVHKPYKALFQLKPNGEAK